LFCLECGSDLRKASDSPPVVDYTQPESYTPKFLADKILTTRSAMEGERKLVTVFFADVANYTGISEKLDPEEVHQIMDGAFRILMDEIHRFEGTINQFTGDGVMALFGAPLAHEDHAQRACHAALSVQKNLGQYGEKIQADTGLEFKMRMGLNSGHVIVGSIGDDLRMDYTAVGDTTNLAARMEDMAKPGSVLVSTNTHRLAADYFEFDTLGKLEVKGKEKPQEAWELLKSSAVATRIGASISKGLTRFVGRQNSMDLLNEAFDKVKSLSGQVVGVVGEAGVGKSRLLLEFGKQLPQDGYAYLEGRCIHYGSSMPYLPILDILRSYFEITEGDREFLIRKKIRDKTLALDEKLENDISPILELLSLPTEDEEYTNLDPRIKKEKTFEALRNILIRQSRVIPLVLVIEDLHWIDNTTQEFINYLIDWVPGSRILLLLLYRPEYTHQWGSKSFYTKIGLDQLEPEYSLELIKAILEESDVAEDLKELIINKAAGNPLFMEEFTQNLVENGTIEKQDNVFVVSKQIDAIQVPETVQGIIAARMDRLEDNLKRTMQVASVIGRDFAFKILHSITDTADFRSEELKSYLLNLQGLEFIYEIQIFPELEYIFKHALIQDVAYNSLLQSRRKEIHKRIGQAIEELYPDRLVEYYQVLAHHYSQAENLEKAYEYSKLSGDKAKESYNHQEALTYFFQAIGILDQMPENQKMLEEQLEIRLLMIRPMHDLMYPEKSLEILEQGVKLAEELENSKALAFFYARLAYYHTFKGDPQLVLKHNEAVFKQAQNEGDIDAMALSAVGLCITYYYLGEVKKLTELAPGVIRTIEKSNRISDDFGMENKPYFWLKIYYSVSLLMMGNIEEAKKLFEETLPLISEDLYLKCLNRFYYGILLTEIGEYEKAIESLQNSFDCAEESQLTYMKVNSLTYMGYANHHQKSPDRAREYFKKAAELQPQIEDTTFGYVMYWSLFIFHLDEKELGKAKTCARKIEELSRKTSHKLAIFCSKFTLEIIKGLEEPSNLKSAEETILEAVDLMEKLHQKSYYHLGYFFLGELFANAGQKKKAEKYLKKAESLYQEMGFVYWLDRTREVLDRIS